MYDLRMIRFETAPFASWLWLFFLINADNLASPQALRELGAPPEIVGRCDLLYAPNPLRTIALAVAKDILFCGFFV